MKAFLNIHWNILWKPGLLQSTGSQNSAQLSDWTELNWCHYIGRELLRDRMLYGNSLFLICLVLAILKIFAFQLVFFLYICLMYLLIYFILLVYLYWYRCTILLSVFGLFPLFFCSYIYTFALFWNIWDILVFQFILLHLFVLVPLFPEDSHKDN